MKKAVLSLVFICSLTATLYSQNNPLPNHSLMTTSGERISSRELSTGGNPLLMVFWNTGNTECLKQVEALVNIRDEYLKNTGVKVVGVFVVNDGDWAKIRPIVSGKSWEMELYIDVNSELSRDMCIPQLPYTILYNGDMKFVCSHIGYCAGIDDLLCQKVRDCLAVAK